MISSWFDSAWGHHYSAKPNRDAVLVIIRYIEASFIVFYRQLEEAFCVELSSVIIGEGGISQKVDSWPD